MNRGSSTRLRWTSLCCLQADHWVDRILVDRRSTIEAHISFDPRRMDSEDVFDPMRLARDIIFLLLNRK